MWLERLLNDEELREKISAKLASGLTKPSEDSCWEWTRQRLSGGYGVIFIGQSRNANGKFDTGKSYVHRVAFVLANKRMPLGGNVLHRCDNPPCANPSHLFEGTHADNIADKISKGRAHSMKGVWSGEANPAAKYTAEQALAIVAMTHEGQPRAKIARALDVPEHFIDAVRRGAWGSVTGYSKENPLRGSGSSKR